MAEVMSLNQMRLREVAQARAQPWPVRVVLFCCRWWCLFSARRSVSRGMRVDRARELGGRDPSPSPQPIRWGSAPRLRE